MAETGDLAYFEILNTYFCDVKPSLQNRRKKKKQRYLLEFNME
jgi:hypothetical protein